MAITVTVRPFRLQDGSITNDKVASNAAIVNSKIALPTVGTLTGTTPTWAWTKDADRKKITLSGNTTVTLTGLSDGATGVLWVTQDSTPRTLALAHAGMTVIVESTGGGVIGISSGSGAIDRVAFEVVGTVIRVMLIKNFT